MARLLRLILKILIILKTFYVKFWSQENKFSVLLLFGSALSQDGTTDSMVTGDATEMVTGWTEGTAEMVTGGTEGTEEMVTGGTEGTAEMLTGGTEESVTGTQDTGTEETETDETQTGTDPIVTEDPG